MRYPSAMTTDEPNPTSTDHAYVPPPDGPTRGNTGCATCGRVAVAHDLPTLADRGVAPLYPPVDPPDTDIDTADWTHPVDHATTSYLAETARSGAALDAIVAGDADVDASTDLPDLPGHVTPLDRINPLTGRGPSVRELGTATGRLTPPADPPLQPSPSPSTPHLPDMPTLSPRVIERNVLPVQDLLERAGSIIHEQLHEALGHGSDPVLHQILNASRVPELRGWLTAYMRLAGSED